jgi:hypothetical protein
VKITKKQLKKLIREAGHPRIKSSRESLLMDKFGPDGESRRNLSNFLEAMGLLEQCPLSSGEEAAEPISVAAPEEAISAVLETDKPEGQLMVEMELASRSLGQVVESINTAAQLCPGCVEQVAAAGPLVEAMVSQAEALKETLGAVGELVKESAGAVENDVSMVVQELV